MNLPGGIQRPWLSAAGLLAALALAVKGVQELPDGTGWPFFLIALAIVGAVVARQTRFRN